MTKRYGTPGPRSIYPTAAASVRLSRCSVEAQLLFDRLIASSDDQGRQPGAAELVKAACMPLIKKATLPAVGRWLSELEHQELVVLYEASDQPLIQIRNWWDHQEGQRHVYASRWPAPPRWKDRLQGNGAGNLPQSAADGGESGTKPSRAVPEPLPGQSRAVPDARELPAMEDLATAACRLLPDGGRWLADQDYVAAWEDLERRFQSWPFEELQPAYAELIESGKRIRAWDLQHKVEWRCAERQRVLDLDTEEAQQREAIEETKRLRQAQKELTPEERERQELFRRAIGLWIKGGRHGKVPEKTEELRAWIADNEQHHQAGAA